MVDDGFSIAEAGDDDGTPRGRRVVPFDPTKAEAKEPRPRRGDVVAEIIGEAELWRSPDGVAHATWRNGIVPEHARVASAPFREMLTLRFYEARNAGLSGQALAEGVALASARALASGVTRRPWRRWAAHGGAIYLDLGGGDPLGERGAVHITRDGWRIVEADAVPVAFLRAPDAVPMPRPDVDAAKAEDLRAFVHAEGDDLALVWGWLLCAARPFEEGGAYPIAFLHGEQGSGKSSATRALQALVDPSSLTGRALPREERDLFVTAAARHLLAFDNVSSLTDGFSDSFARIATGGAFTSRALHTDGDEASFVATKPLLMNGIPSGLLGRPDLAERALAIELRPIAERRQEQDMRAAFEAARPGLLGLLCDGLAAALRRSGEVRLEKLPRMADACLWAEAGAEGLGIAAGTIARGWHENREAADRDALATDDMARAVVALLAEREAEGRAEWSGEPAELYRLLCSHAGEKAAGSRLWPKNAAGMARRLERIAPPLRAVHRIACERGRGGADGARWWCVRRL